MSIGGVILAVLVFSLIVIFHELGHLLAAKACDVKVNEFCLGLGPTIFSFGKGETKYSLKLFPFGGACMMEGEDAESEDGRAFYNKNVWQRILIVVMGPFFNFIMAYVLSVVLIGCMGVDTPVLTEILPGYAAEEAGIEPGDKIISLDNYKVNFYTEITIYTTFHSTEDVSVVYERAGQRYTKVLTPKLEESTGRYLLGFVKDYGREKVGPLECLKYGFSEMKFQIYTTFKSLGMMLSGQVGLNQVSGPVGIVSTIDDVYQESADSGAFYIFINMINIAILLSANLGVMNLLPIPALDGGRLLFLIVEAVIRKRIPEKYESAIHFAGFVLLFGLMIVVMFSDIIKLFY